MQRKHFIYLLALLSMLLAIVPLSVAAEQSGPTSQAAETVGAEALPSAADAKLATDGPAAPAAPAVNPAAVLYDNGTLVTHPGGGAGGANASAVQTGLGNSTYGFGHAISTGFRMADDFTVPAGGWNISTITFYAYQTGSTTTTTINNVNLRIWDGQPGASNIVFGDTTTNRLAGSSFSNIYRVLDTGLLDTARPIMADVVTVNTILPAGTYWLDWQTGGTLTSGPWAPPVTILGQTSKPGSNGQQYNPTTAAWGPAIDTGANAVQDLPFVIEGATAQGPSISLQKTVGTTPGVCAGTSNITVPQGTTVYYCYTVTNTGDTTLDTHTLTDSVLGTIFTGTSYSLAPGASVDTIALGYNVTMVANANTTNVGTWTASNQAGAQATATATANVTVVMPRCPAGSTEVTLLTEGFEGSFPPAGWTVSNTTTGCTGVPGWTNTDPGANSNLTGGTGLFATADSDACGSGVSMNAQMWSSVLDMTGLTDPQISFAYDYNDLGAADSGALDISTDGGATWANEFTWTLDDRGPRTYTSAIAGAGENDVVVRWHYVAGWDWWWQVDDVVVTACEPANEPNIYVDPLSMASTQPPDVQVQDTLTISNTGGGTLTWQIDEESTLFEAGTPSGSKDAPAGTQTLSAGGPYAHGMKAVAPVIRGGEALVNDGSFENGPPPGSAWTEVTNSVCEWIGDWSGVWGVAAYDGTMDFWAGGYCGGTATSSSVAQTVPVPPVNTTLSFWILSYRPDPDDAALDQAYVEVNGTPVWTYDLIQANDTYPNWVNVTVDLSAYAGQNVSLELGATSAGTETGNIRFDYVEFAGPPPPACTVLSDMPWLTLTPTNGATAGGADTDVTVTFDSTGMTPGVYTGNLCVTSDDPDAGPGNETDLVIVPVTLTVTEAPRCPVGYQVVTLATEGFEGAFPPAGWSVANTTTGCTGVPDWTNTDPGARGNLTGGSGLFAIADSDQCGSSVAMDASMWTGAMNMATLVNPELEFKYDFTVFSGGERGYVDVSTDGGTTWSNELTVSADAGPVTYSDGIAGAGSSNVMVRWHYVAGWDWWWQVDDVVVTACEPIPTAVTVSAVSASPVGPAAGLPLAAFPAAVSLALGAAYVLRRRQG